MEKITRDIGGCLYDLEKRFGLGKALLHLNE